MICSIERVKENIQICEDIFMLTIEGNFEAEPGQFYMIKVPYREPLLPRPISVYDIYDDKIVFLYKVVGEGTKLLSKLKDNDEIQLMGPLGNGFNLGNIRGRVAMVSGGVGIAPLTFLTKRLEDCEIDFYAGFCMDVYAVDSVEENVNNLTISVEREIIGNKLQSYQQENNVKVVDNSYITDILEVDRYEFVICCGPKIMMEKVVNMCIEKNVPIYVSMENRMACGIGACLGCTCKTKSGYERVCSEGPVFNGEDLVIHK